MLKIDSKQLKAVFNYLLPSFGGNVKNKMILIEGNKLDNKLVFRANNIIETTIELISGNYQIDKDFTVCVDRFIYDVIGNLKDKIEFLIDKESLIIKNGKNKFEFSTLDGNNFPNKIQHNTENLILIDDKEDFINPFYLSSFCVSNEDDIPVYKSFNLDKKSLSTTNENQVISINKDFGKSNPPAKELLSIFNAIKGLNKEDEIFYRFGSEYCIIKVSAKEFDAEYIFTPIDNNFSQGFYDMMDRFNSQTSTLSFDIQNEDVVEIINTANIFAQKAKQESYPSYVTMAYEKNGNDKVNFLMKIGTSYEFNLVTPVENLVASTEQLEIDFDPIDFAKFLKIGGNITMNFFEDEVGFLCTSSEYANLIYIQALVRKRK